MNDRKVSRYNVFTMKINDFNFMIGGKAGEGIDVPGSLFSKLCMQIGLYVHTASEFQNVIKGYNNTFQIRASEKPLISHIDHYDLMLALDKETTDEYLDRVKEGGGVIYDSEIAEGGILKAGVKSFSVPLKALAKEKAGLELAKKHCRNRSHSWTTRFSYRPSP